MAAQLLKGKPIADKIKEEIKKQLSQFKTKPVLASIQVGENAASAVYLKSQQKNADALGIDFTLHNLDENTDESELIKFIHALNKDQGVNGIIVQLPLPKGCDHKVVMNELSPEKDAEGMHPANLGKVLLGNYNVAPCTALAALELIESTGVKLYGKEAVVVGHSEIVGKPLSLLLLNKFATTTVCHIATGERGVLADHVKRAEILVVAVGKANLIKGDWIKDGAIVVDVGINRVGDKLVGDVEFEEASQHAKFITPVPGGVGPLTVTILMRNVVELFKNQKS